VTFALLKGQEISYVPVRNPVNFQHKTCSKIVLKEVSEDIKISVVMLSSCAVDSVNWGAGFLSTLMWIQGGLKTPSFLACFKTTQDTDALQSGFLGDDSRAAGEHRSQRRSAAPHTSAGGPG
jgi:hypothetical protein